MKKKNSQILTRLDSNLIIKRMRNLTKPDRDIKFYDTSSLLFAGEEIFKKKNKFLISSITLHEIEKIKTSDKKDSTIKYLARNLTRLLVEHTELYEVIIHKEEYETLLSCHSRTL